MSAYKMNRIWICSLIPEYQVSKRYIEFEGIIRFNDTKTEINFVGRGRELLYALYHIERIKCSDEMEDFPLDTDDTKGSEATEFPVNENNAEMNSGINEKVNLEVLTSSKGSIAMFNQIMMTAMKKPSAKQRLAQVLPIIRSMSPSQRLTLATLVLKQLMSKSEQPNISFIDQSDNKTSELMIPISLDIASIFNGLGKDAGSGRSSVFGTYYYNPLSAGYRVAIPQPQRPSSPFNIRRFQLPNSHRKDDVPPEMMPPPYSPPSNMSYENFNKKPEVQEVDDDNDDDSSEDSEEQEDDEKEVVEDNMKGEINKMYTNKDCVPYVNNLCLDVNVYPKNDILNSIRNIEEKHIFRALVEDFTKNTTVDSPEIERRLSNEENENLQICVSKVKYARPKKAKSMHGNWKYVVNTERYTQTVRVETCLNANKACSYLNENVKSHCKQIYNYHRLLTWDEKSGLSLDLFKIPTCCSCQIQYATPLANTKKYSSKPDTGIQENIIIDEPTVFQPTVSKPQKPKNKPNLPFIPKHESLNRSRRPSPVLPTYHEGNNRGPPPGIRYSPNDNSIRRTSLKNNVPKVYVPAKGTYDENAEVENSSLSHRVNYNYHPIIDFFKSTAPGQIDRGDMIDEWQPMTEGPRSMRI